MKKQLITLVAMLLPMLASADAVEIDGIYYNLITKGKVAEVTYNPNGYSGDIVIPESVPYNGVDYSVTSIGFDAFGGCSGLTSISIPGSVTSIGKEAFYKCSGLTSVTIPNSVTSIGERAFGKCSSLISVTIPGSVTSIGNSAFSYCYDLTSVHISDLDAWCKISFGDYSNPLLYAHHLFLNGEEIKDLVIPNSVTSISNWAFYECSGLTSVTIPNSVTSIGDAAFCDCIGLTSITIPNSVISIGVNSFSYCSGLTSVTIPNSVTSIGNAAFQVCIGLTSVTIPNSVTSIGDEAFKGCSGLTSVIIGSGIKNIYSQAFASCPELTDVYCYAEKVPSMWIVRYGQPCTDAFDGSYIEYATLHVPAASVNDYKTTAPWSGFKSIEAIDGETPETQKCATPVIIYENGKLMFACATEGVEYVTDITCADIKKHYSSAIDLTGTYTVSVYATKSGYDNSDVATKEINISSASGSGELGDLNNDGKTDAADVVKLVNIISGQ
ncbi:MAG: leucine-rich repeat domain-containing protein [Prevotella sp.]|nr:leucine-rich repeat domain-containing protein [Prevotella sp.]